MKFKLKIKQITNQIIQNYYPLKIILFGSAASGKEKKNSDLDFLIIKETNQDPIKRVQQLSSLVNRDIPCDFLIYTPQELKQRYQLNDSFIIDILQKGKILYEKQ